MKELIFYLIEDEIDTLYLQVRPQPLRVQSVPTNWLELSGGSVNRQTVGPNVNGWARVIMAISLGYVQAPTP